MTKKIAVLCEQFFKMDGTDSLFGGGERWLVDFVSLLKKLNYEVDCYQFSTKPWTKRYKKMVVKGLGNISGIPQNTNNDYINGINEFEQLAEKSDGIFLLSMNLSVKKFNKSTLTVSHGLMFDGMLPGQQQRPNDMLNAFKQWVRNSDHTLSVDSNSVKVMQVYNRDTASKMSFVPNYVSLEEFIPNEKLNDEPFTVLFPRRLDFCRGFTTMMSAVDILREKYPDIQWTFCGRGNQNETNYFNTWLQKNPTNIEYLWQDMSDMPKIYKKATISCVPTIYAEGTSLSALESLSSGVPVVATCIGGLTDIVQNEINGLLINPDYSKEFNNPDSSSLVEAIEYMYHNREHLAEMRENGLRMIRHFGKDRWETQVTKIIRQVYGD